MNNRRITSLLIVMALVLTSFTSVFAANFDIKVKDANKDIPVELWTFDSFILINMMENSSNYTIEFGDEHYEIEEVLEVLENNPELELEEIVKELEPVKESEGLEVVEVSAIDKTITLNVAALEPAEDAKANLAIFAVDAEGEKTGLALVTKNGVEIEDNKVVFDLSSKADFGDKNYVVTVKVGTVEEAVNVTLEFKAVEKLVVDINAANKAKLAILLADETYFTGFDAAKVDDYFTTRGTPGTMKTVAEVQEKVIDAVEANSEFATFKEKLTSDKIGEYAKYQILKGQFSNVLDDNMPTYMTTTSGKIFGADLKTLQGTMTSFEAMSKVIDEINLEALVGTSAPAFNNTSKLSDLNELKADLTDLVLVKKDTQAGGKTKTEWITAIDAQLKKIADAKEDALEVIEAAKEAMAAFEVAFGEDFAEENEYEAVADAIEALEVILAKEDVTEKAITDKLNNDKDDFSTNLIAALELATDAITGVADADAFKVDYADVLAISLVPGAEDQVEYTDLADIQAALKAFNKLGQTAKGALGTEEAKLKDLEVSAMSRFLIDVNLAGPTPLVELLDFVGNSQYARLDSVQKREVAELFQMEIKNGTKGGVNSNTYTTDFSKDADVKKDFNQTIVIDLATTVSNYKEYLQDINSATTYAEMKLALTDLGTAYGITGGTLDLASIKVLDGRPEGGFELFAEIFELVK